MNSKIEKYITHLNNEIERVNYNFNLYSQDDSLLDEIKTLNNSFQTIKQYIIENKNYLFDENKKQLEFFFQTDILFENPKVDALDSFVGLITHRFRKTEYTSSDGIPYKEYFDARKSIFLKSLS